MKNLQEVLNQFTEAGGTKLPYPMDAYAFLMDALHFTVSRYEKTRHVTGQELLEGIRDYALQEFGPMARTVFNYWQIHETLDFGKLVFALVEAGILRKQPHDKLEDFKDGYDFDKAFVCSFDDFNKPAKTKT
jgi:uncharacterized repeat protein (TIGR04138 family)